MIYIKKGLPLPSISQKAAEIRRRMQWKDLDLNALLDKEEAAKYTNILRSMFDEFSKDDLRTTILREQHYLCAYCMRRIHDDGKSTRIEHWYPLNKNKQAAIDYQNFLGVCRGLDYQNQQTHPCCDNSKSGDIITLDPRDQRMMAQICYESDGRIYFRKSNNWTELQTAQFQKELDEILMLNGDDPLQSCETNSRFTSGCSELKSQRRAAYRGCSNSLRRLYARNAATTTTIQKIVKKLESKTVYDEYVGVMIFYYKRWLSNHS